jgi:hypothetical protein
MIVLTGSDLATGSWMYTTLAFIHGRISIFKMLQHWVLTFFGNLAGALFMVAIIFGCEYRGSSVSVTLSDVNRWRRVRHRRVPEGVDRLCDDEAGRAALPSDLSQGDWM